MHRTISVSSISGVEPVVVQQNDVGSRQITFVVLKNSHPLDMAGMEAKVFYRKNRATSPAYSAQITEGNVQHTIPEDVMVHAGDGEMQLVLTKSGYRLHSFAIPFSVRGSLSFTGEAEDPADDPMAVNWINLPGKPATFPPAAHTHTPAQAGALAAGGTAVNAAKLGGKLPECYLSPQNLLNDSYFINPINQRGKTSYSGAGYTIDRWRQSNAYSITEVGSGFVLFAASGGIAYPRQYVQFFPGMYGKTYTAAVCTTDGAITVASALITEDAVDAETTLASATIASGVMLRLTKATDSRISVRIDVSDGNSVSLRWAVLYEGAYTKDNLPPYVYRGDAAELLECERYCFVISQYALYHHAIITANTITFTVPIPIRMRLKPSFESGTLLVCNANGVVQSGFTFAVEVLGNGFVRITATKTAHGLTSAALRADTDVVLSSDL